MKFLSIFFIIFSLSICEGEETILQLKERHELRLLEIEKSYSAATTEQEKKEKAFEKACALIDMQRLKDAFLFFLEAIEVRSFASFTQDTWDTHMQMVMPLYLSSLDTDEQAECLEKEIASRQTQVSSSHPLFILLGCSFANKGIFSSFLTHVYKPIQKDPDSYLAWKVRGMLYIKIFESSSSLEERVCYKNKALECFQIAHQRLPEDMRLAVKILFFTQGMEQEESFYAKKIFKNCMKRHLKAEWVSKVFMQQVLREFMDLKMYNETREMLVLYDSLFGYSRVIEEMQMELSYIEKDQGICALKKGKS